MSSNYSCTRYVHSNFMVARNFLRIFSLYFCTHRSQHPFKRSKPPPDSRCALPLRLLCATERATTWYFPHTHAFFQKGKGERRSARHRNGVLREEREDEQRLAQLSGRFNRKQDFFPFLPNNHFIQII